MKRFALICALAAIAFGTACSEGGSSSTSAVSGQSAPSHEPASTSEPLFDRIALAPLHVRHSGMRRLEFHYDSGGSAHTLEYEERVSADGEGRFALDPVRVSTPAMTPGQHEVFELIQKKREGFFYRYRDFGVRQRQLFLSNYRITELNSSLVVADRKCIEIDVRRSDGVSNSYVAAVDIETALVLRCTEFAPDGHIVSKLEFTSIDFDPALDEVEWFVPRDPNDTEDLSDSALAELGFSPATPRTLPKGYQLLHSEVLHQGRDRWVRRVYGDGVESLFVLHSHGYALEAQVMEPRANGPALAQSRDVVGTNSEPLKVRLCAAGPWTLAEVVRGDDRVFVVGKIPESDVVRLLQSAL